MMTDAKRVDNLADLSEFKSSTSELSQRYGSRFVSRFERARGLPELQGGKVHGRHIGSAQGAHAGGGLVQSPGVDLHGTGSSPSHDEQVRSAKDMQTPNTVLVWIDGAWSGEPVSCKPLFAGGGRLKNHAIDAPRVSRWETSECRWKQDHDIYENSEQSGNQRGCKIREGHDRANDPSYCRGARRDGQPQQ